MEDNEIVQYIPHTWERKARDTLVAKKPDSESEGSRILCNIKLNSMPQKKGNLQLNIIIGLCNTSIKTGHLLSDKHVPPCYTLWTKQPS
jgi:hypothetical protein